MAGKKVELVHCRYINCSKLHESTELSKNDAVLGDNNRYYHRDCYHMMRTIIEIRDLFYEKINPLLTEKQVGMLVKTINKIVFEKQVDVDFLKFSVEYMIRYKPGKLRYPLGLYYIIQNEDIIAMWQREKDRKIRVELKAEIERREKESDKGEVAELDLPEISTEFNGNKHKLTKILGV